MLPLFRRGFISPKIRNYMHTYGSLTIENLTIEHLVIKNLTISDLKDWGIKVGGG